MSIAETPEPKCADCGHGTLAHNAIGGACTQCECGHYRPESRCRRCKHLLRSAASIAAKIGPRCAAIEAATEGLNAKQVDKMQQLIADKAIVATSRKGVFKVVNEAGEVIHTCHVNGNCDCRWGLRRDSAETKTCYHAGAARLLARPVIRRTAPAPAPVALPSSEAMWAEMDRWNDAFMAMA